MSGQLNLIIGPMFSGKTTELIRRYRRHKVAGRSCLFIKFDGDSRYEVEKVTTHDKITVDALKTDLLSKLDKEVNSYDVVCIDEVQFYSDAPFFLDHWATKGKIIDACGLNSTFERRPFKVVSKLIAQADNIIHLTAICEKTKNNAPFSKRIVKNKEEKLIGGKEFYRAVDRNTFFERSSNPQENLERDLRNLLSYFFFEGVINEQEMTHYSEVLDQQINSLDPEVGIMINFKALDAFIKKE